MYRGIKHLALYLLQESTCQGLTLSVILLFKECFLCWIIHNSFPYYLQHGIKSFRFLDLGFPFFLSSPRRITIATGGSKPLQGPPTTTPLPPATLAEVPTATQTEYTALAQEMTTVLAATQEVAALAAAPEVVVFYSVIRLMPFSTTITDPQINLRSMFSVSMARITQNGPKLSD